MNITVSTTCLATIVLLIGCSLKFAQPTDAIASPMKPKEIKLSIPAKVMANGKALTNRSGHAGPNLIDFDGDGNRDLLVGNIWGNVRLYKNTSTSSRPVFSDQGDLKIQGKVIKLDNW